MNQQVTTADAMELIGRYGQGLSQVACNCIHMFAPGIYVRQVQMPAGSLIVGHLHKTPHLNIFLKGRLTLINDDGSRLELTAPMICVANPGRKMAYIHEDSTWLNLHATDITDVVTLEALYLEMDPSFIELQKNFTIDRPLDRQDFDNFIWERGFNAEQIRDATEEQMMFPWGPYRFKVDASAIEGKGLIATCDICENDVIAPVRLDGKRTPAIHWVNHARNANAKIAGSADSDELYLVALRDIAGSLGGMDGEEITIDYRDAIKFFNIGRVQ
jgi:hypothetical protein